MKRMFKSLIVWQNYVGYLVVTLALTIYLNIKGVTIFFGKWYMPTKFFLYIFLITWGVHTLVRLIFRLLPEPHKWEDDGQ